MCQCARILPLWEIHVHLPVCVSLLLEVWVLLLCVYLCCFHKSTNCMLLRKHPENSHTHTADTLVPIYFLLCCQSASWVQAVPGIWWGGCSPPVGWLQAGSNTAQLLVYRCLGTPPAITNLYASLEALSRFWESLGNSLITD